MRSEEAAVAATVIFRSGVEFLTLAALGGVLMREFYFYWLITVMLLMYVSLILRAASQ